MGKSFVSWLISGLMILTLFSSLHSSKVLSYPISQTHLEQSNPGNNAPDKNETSSLKTLTNSVIKASAHISIFSAELIASDAAEKELTKFRTGNHQGNPKVFSNDSVATKELFNGTYYQELTDHLVEELANWYKGKIPESGGLFSQANTFRVFAPSDALWEFTDGIDMADIIGTFTYYVRATTSDGMIYFQGVNKISLESYSGENYLGHGLVNNPKLGPLSSTAQVFKWQIEIPEKYRK
jgi:hypothetical protein